MTHWKCKGRRGSFELLTAGYSAMGQVLLDRSRRYASQQLPWAPTARAGWAATTPGIAVEVPGQDSRAEESFTLISPFLAGCWCFAQCVFQWGLHPNAYLTGPVRCLLHSFSWAGQVAWQLLEAAVHCCWLWGCSQGKAAKNSPDKTPM